MMGRRQVRNYSLPPDSARAAVGGPAAHVGARSTGETALITTLGILVGGLGAFLLFTTKAGPSVPALAIGVVGGGAVGFLLAKDTGGSA